MVLSTPFYCEQGLLSGGGGAKRTSAANALEALTEDNSVLLVDIRSQAAVKEEGSPALGRTAGKSISLPFTKASFWPPAVGRCRTLCSGSVWAWDQRRSRGQRRVQTRACAWSWLGCR